MDAGWGMYAGVRQGLAELSLFEDIVQSGSVASGDVGICKQTRGRSDLRIDVQMLI